MPPPSCRGLYLKFRERQGWISRRRIGASLSSAFPLIPWHRARLAGFEKLLRDSDPPRTANVTIPYWDWTKPASGKMTTSSKVGPRRCSIVDAGRPAMRRRGMPRP
jgi:hypothetical protein